MRLHFILNRTIVMWNRVVGQIGQAWNQNYPLTDEKEEIGVNGVSSTQTTHAELGSELTSEQYIQIILAKEVRFLAYLSIRCNPGLSRKSQSTK